MKKQMFEIRIAVVGDDERVQANVEVWKDGKASDFRLLEGDNLRLACESLKNATGLAARAYLDRLYREGQIDDGQYKIMIKPD